MELTRTDAVQVVETWLAHERHRAEAALAWVRDVEIADVEQHDLGWLVFLDAVEYPRTGDLRHRLGCGPGPLLVDGADRSLHHIPVTTYASGEWEALYPREVPGLEAPDPVAALVRTALDGAGLVAAVREVRRHTSEMTIAQARRYVDALATIGAPPEELALLTREPERCPPLPITCLAPASPDAPEHGPHHGPPRARTLGLFRELVPGEERAPSVLPYLRATPDADAAGLASYLRAGSLIVVAASAAYCRLAPGQLSLGSWALLTDGTWFWHSDLAHYVEHHGLLLPPVFVDHARSQRWVPPRLSPERLLELERESWPEEA